jgi:hypothetical protein
MFARDKVTNAWERQMLQRFASGSLYKKGICFHLCLRLAEGNSSVDNEL